jgi:very-short-patch-repair endonuclease
MRGPNAKSTNRARSLRREQTAAESELWACLRNRQLGGVKFSRQVSIGPFFADFCCREAKLVIEIDGVTHETPEELSSDHRRSARLKAQGYAILHAQVKMQIISEGLDPTIGMSHSTEKCRDPLVLDRMEPLRPVVDKEILRLILNSPMSPGDFTITNEGFCRLNRQLARKVVAVASSVLAV